MSGEGLGKDKNWPCGCSMKTVIWAHTCPPTTRASRIAEASELGNRLSKLLREIGATEMVITQKGWNRTYKVVGRPMGTTGYEGEVA